MTNEPLSLNQSATTAKQFPVRLTIWIVAAIGLLAIAAGSAIAWLVAYQPVTLGSAFAAPGATQVRNALGVEYQFAYQKSGTFEFVVSILNNGPLPITIRDVKLPSTPYSKPRGVEFATGENINRGGLTLDSTHSGPVALQGGERAVVKLTYNFADCGIQDEFREGSITFSTFQVHYSVAWLSKSTDIKLRGPVSITGVGGTCAGTPIAGGI